MILRKMLSELVGTAFLLMTVVGSGIMGERLAGGNVAVALLANSLATGAALVVLLSIFGPISGAHFNPIVTLALREKNRMSWLHTVTYIVTQIVGAVLGVWIAHAMFGEPIFMTSTHTRTGLGQWIGEIVAACGLLLTIVGCDQNHPRMVPAAVGLYITAAYWFTSSTSFANPAASIARGLTDTFAGILPADIPGFIAAQIVGGVAAMLLCRGLFPQASVEERS